MGQQVKIKDETRSQDTEDDQGRQSPGELQMQSQKTIAD